MTNDPTLTAFYEDNDAPFVYEHVMIDIESMSLSKHNALILSIGMVEFDPTPLSAPLIGSRSRLLVNIEQQLLLGREVSKGTQKFWQAQSKEASDHWANYAGERNSIAQACKLVQRFCDRASRVWANGTQFDLSNLEELNNQLGEDNVGELWHYQKPRDMRTFCRETQATRLRPAVSHADNAGVAHDPVYDCVEQIWHVWEHWQS